MKREKIVVEIVKLEIRQIIRPTDFDRIEIEEGCEVVGEGVESLTEGRLEKGETVHARINNLVQEKFRGVSS